MFKIFNRKNTEKIVAQFSNKTFSQQMGKRQIIQLKNKQMILIKHMKIKGQNQHQRSSFCVYLQSKFCQIRQKIISINKQICVNPIFPPFDFIYSIISKVQFILMTSFNQNPLFYTPERLSKPNNNKYPFSTTLTKQGNELELRHGVQATNFSQQLRTKGGRDVANFEKLTWLEERTEQLRRYINSNSQISKNHIQLIFGWGDEYQAFEGTQQKILKHLSSKVKALIKENHELRGNCQNEEIVLLRKQNEDLKTTIDQFHRGQATRQLILSEENQYLREYIERHKADLQRQRNTKNHKIQQQNSFISSNNQHVIQSQQNITNLRKYVMNYINTVIEANDHQLQMQQQYIHSLQKRISNLNTFQNIIEHLQFEKKVKLQDSNRKTKNFSVGTPKIIGDRISYDEQQQPIKQQPQRKQKKQSYFKSKVFKQDNEIRPNKSAIKLTKDESRKDGKQILNLQAKITQLQQQLSTLQQKYDIQIENHIRDSSERQELVTNIQKLNAQKSQLKHQVTDLKERLIIVEAKANNFQNEAKKRITQQDAEFYKKSDMSLKDELISIKGQLQAYGINKFKQIEKQIKQLVNQRDFFKRQLSTLQNSLSKNTKFSSTQKELFLLRQKNNQLEHNCRFYQDQLAQYQKQLRLISEQNEHRLAKDISNDFKEMRKDDLKGLSWVRQAHSCMVNSINRLQNLQNRLKYNKQR